MRTIILMLVVFLFPDNSLFSQNIDSLRELSTNLELEDTVMCKVLIDLSNEYRKANLDSSLYYADLALRFSEKNCIDYRYHAVEVFKSVLVKRFDIEDAQSFIISEIDKIENQNILFTLYLDLATTYQYQGLFKEAIRFNENAISNAEDDDEISLVYVNMGNLYADLKNYVEAEKYYSLALEVARQEVYNPSLNSYVQNGLGTIFLEQEKYTIAIAAFEKSFESAKTSGEQAISLNNLGICYMNLKNYSKAEENYSQALLIYKKNLNYGGIADVHLDKGNLDILIKDYEGAIKDCMLSFKINKEDSYLLGQMDNLACLYQAYAAKGDFENAFIYHKEYKILHDSIYSVDQAKEITQITLEKEFEKEREVLSIEQEKKEAIALADMKLRNIVIVGLSGLVLISIFSYYNSNKKKRIITSQNEQLQKLNKTKDRIFAIVAHDLRKPVISFNNVVQKIGYLLDRKEFETLELFNKSIQNEANALNSLTDNLLKWALVEKEILPHNPISINLKELMLDTLEIFKSTAEDKGIEVIIEIDDTHFVMADRQAMMTIIRNLIDNAIKFTPRNGIVTVHSKCAGSLIELLIKDTGQGIPASKMSALFELTNNKSVTGTRGEKGTGLGLHIVKELLTINKCEIEVSSIEGNGTRFMLSLPMAS